jgi:hypothetical protein
MKVGQIGIPEFCWKQVGLAITSRRDRYQSLETRPNAQGPRFTGYSAVFVLFIYLLEPYLIVRLLFCELALQHFALPLPLLRFLGVQRLCLFLFGFFLDGKT